eukprot:jgi/Picre1/32754/NNA_008099.t1
MASTVQTGEELLDNVASCLQRRGSASCAVGDDYILIFGGENGEKCFRDCWKFHVSEKRFEFVGEAPETCSPRSFHTATLIGGVVWLIVGETCLQRRDKSWTMFGILISCRKAGIMLMSRVKRKLWAKTLISKHKCLAVYDPSTMTWLNETSGKGEVPSARYSHVSSCGDLIVIVSGVSWTRLILLEGYSVSVAFRSEEECLHLAQGRVKKTGLIQHRVGHVQSIIDDTLYIMGGFYQHSYHVDVNILKFFIGETSFT